MKFLSLVTVGVVTLILGGILGWFAKSNTELKDDVPSAGDQRSQSSRSEVGSSLTSRTLTKPQIQSLLSSGILLTSSQDEAEHLEAWGRLINGFTAENASQVYADLVPLVRSLAIPEDLWNRFAIRAGELAGEEIVDLEPPNKHASQAGLTYLIEGWAKVDPHFVAKWSMDLGNGHHRNQVARGIFRGAMSENPEVAAQVYYAGAGQSNWSFVDAIRESFGYGDAIEHLHKLAKARTHKVDEATAKRELAHFYHQLNDSAKEMNWEEKADSLLKYADDPWFPSNAWDGVMKEVQRTDPAAVLDWVVDPKNVMTEPAREKVQDEAIDALVKYRGPFVDWIPDWMSENQEHPIYDRLLSKFVLAGAREDPEGSLIWAETARDQEIRKMLEERIRQMK